MIEYSIQSDFNSGKAKINIEGTIEEISNLKSFIGYYYDDDLYYFSGDGRYSKASFINTYRSNAKKYLDNYGVRHFEALHKDIKIIFSGPCTILFINGEKTVVRCAGEPFEYEKGAMMAFLKYTLPKEKWNRLLDMYHRKPKKEKEVAEALIRILYGDDVYARLIGAINDGILRKLDNER